MAEILSWRCPGPSSGMAPAAQPAASWLNTWGRGRKLRPRGQACQLSGLTCVDSPWPWCSGGRVVVVTETAQEACVTCRVQAGDPRGLLKGHPGLSRSASPAAGPPTPASPEVTRGMPARCVVEALPHRGPAHGWKGKAGRRSQVNGAPHGAAAPTHSGAAECPTCALQLHSREQGSRVLSSTKCHYASLSTRVPQM